MTRRLALAVVCVTGCGAQGVTAASCSLMQTAPTLIQASGDRCFPPSDGAHASIVVGDYSVIVTSPDGFAIGKHEDVIVDQVGSTDANWPLAKMVVADDEGWSLDVIASDGQFAAKLSGN